MKRQLLTALLLITVSIMVYAQADGKQLVVWQKNGEKVYYQLADLPETTFENGKLVITTKNATVQYNLANIVRYTYENLYTSIDLLPNERSVIINREDDTVTFQNLKEGSVVLVYGTNGVLLETLRATSGQPLTVSIGQRPAGMYIVKCGSETIKMTKP